MRRRRATAGSVVAVLVALLQPAVADDSRFSELAANTVVFERTTDGPATLLVAAGVGYGARPGGRIDGEAMTGAIGVRDRRGARVASLGQRSVDDDPTPAAYVAGQRVGCMTGGCGAAGSLGVLFNLIELDDEGLEDPEALTKIFVVMQGRDAVVQFQASGWRARVVPLAFRFVSTRQSRAAVRAGAAFNTADVDVFDGAQAQGGPRGSLAVGQLPCGRLVAAGVGDAELLGGMKPDTARCRPGEGDRATVTGSALTRTQWRFTSPAAVGAPGEANVRLLVIDLPRGT